MSTTTITIPASTTTSELHSKIKGIFALARICKYTSDQLRDELNKYIHEPLNVQYSSGKYKFSFYLKGYVQGIIDSEREYIMCNDVEFCYLVDGELYSTHKETTKKRTVEFYIAGKGHLPADYPSDFYWKGTDKPYTTTQ